ncbi:MAG: hypothetical protein K9K66_07920 [Desulfarculaceae bacterium]|nr:hypothetical protein [Desulfarculaceae bacterium]MCF8072052.1 hypothetical protein [Desulfarculaceae bacterium]MCF8101569.1 hypothetical protein [Desulfarculaceae bacterium]MCF8115119.1 hypothetical protein [Desulfarculaceae bacterium]
MSPAETKLEPLRQVTCLGLCRYYKPGKREEPGCGGVEWLDARPALAGRLGELPPAEGDGLFGLAEDDPRLVAVCGSCEFRVDGCDFRDPQVSRSECSPCGGLRALAGLLALGLDLEA